LKKPEEHMHGNVFRIAHVAVITNTSDVQFGVIGLLKTNGNSHDLDGRKTVTMCHETALDSRSTGEFKLVVSGSEMRD